MVPTRMVSPLASASLRWLVRGSLGAPAVRRLGRQVVRFELQCPLQERHETQSLPQPPNRRVANPERSGDVRQRLPASRRPNASRC